MNASDALGLGPAYSYVDDDEIKDFLSRKPHVVDILKELAAFLAEKHGVTKSHIEPFEDHYHGCDALVVTPEYRTEDLDEMLEIQGDVLDAFFYPRKLISHESIVLSI